MVSLLWMVNDMRKVSELDESWEFQYKIIEKQDDGYIISITNPYVSGYNDDDTPIYTDVDENTIGASATWEDVKNLFLFDLKIGNNYYSWDKKDDYYHIGMKGTKIGLVKYSDVHANGEVLGKSKKTIVPGMLGNPPLEIVGGNISVSGSSYADATFYDVSTGEYTTLDSVKKVKGSVEYTIAFPERPIEEE